MSFYISSFNPFLYSYNPLIMAFNYELHIPRPTTISEVYNRILNNPNHTLKYKDKIGSFRIDSSHNFNYSSGSIENRYVMLKLNGISTNKMKELDMKYRDNIIFEKENGINKTYNTTYNTMYIQVPTNTEWFNIQLMDLLMDLYDNGSLWFNELYKDIVDVLHRHITADNERGILDVIKAYHG